MRRGGMMIGLVFVLASCGQPMPVEAGSAAPASGAPAASFAIGVLAENEGQIQGCTRTLSRVGERAGDIFREDGVDSGAKGYIRIDGALIAVSLVSADETEKGGVRIFEDAAHATKIVETLTTGAAHEDSDSVEETGSLAITHAGAMQSMPVEGGTAC